MAAGGSFKQQCPSCDAMVLIKDRKLIGKKIDCTSCKFRFLVEPPAGAEAEEEPKEAAKPPAKGAPAAKKPAPAKPGGPPAKKKVGPRKPLDDDEDEPTAEPQKEGRNNTMLIGIGLAVFCVVLLAVGGYFLLSDSDPNKVGGPPVTRKATTKPADGPGPPPKITDSGEVPTNVLPNDTQVVLNVVVNNVSIETAAFYTPGAFSARQMEHKLGLKPNEVEGLLVGLNVDGKKHWAFAVLRIKTGKSINEAALKTALSLQPAPGGAIKGKEYYVTPPSPWLGNLERTILSSLPLSGDAGAAAEPRSLGIYIVNPTVLIVADLSPLKDFLEAGGEQKLLSPRAASTGKKGEEDRDRYLTIDPGLKQALDRVEGKSAKERRLSLAWDMKAILGDPIKAALRKAGDDPQLVPLGLPLAAMADQLGTVKTGALGVKTHEKEGIVELVLENKDKETADIWHNTFTTVAARVGDVPALALLPFRLEVAGKTVGSATATDKVELSSQTQGGTWLVSAKMASQVLNEGLKAILPPKMVLLRTASDMAEGPSRIFNLAAATQEMAESGLKDPMGAAYKGFPIGACPRSTPVERMGRPYPPSARVGWMPQLLPFLGYESAYRDLRTDDPWKSGKNAEIGAIPVPAFLDSRYKQETWWATVLDAAGKEMRFGATHFVGVAGVGLDAADYDIKDPRAGVFGYDRITRFDDIKDGKATTILMLQVPPDYPRPWIAGGGATIMGVPEKNSVKPFVLPITRDGKKGTYAIMADGSVRFIPETIPDDVFKAMCTINGGEKVNIDKETVEHVLKAKP